MDFSASRRAASMASTAVALQVLGIFLKLVNAAPQGMTMNSNIDPFIRPTSYLPPPPPPTQNYYSAPPPPPLPSNPFSTQPVQMSSSWNTGGSGMVNTWPSYNTVNSPPPNSAGTDINQPIPLDAAPPGATGPSTTSSGGEQEFEQEGGSGGSGGGGGSGGNQMYNPPPAFGVQSDRYYNQGPMSLLDAYYGTGRPQRYAAQAYNNNNGFFGGLFGNSPGGNLLGAFMLNEFIF